VARAGRSLNAAHSGIERELKTLAEQNPYVTRLMTHPGIGTLSGLALVHTLGPVERFATARKVTAYVGLDLLEHSSGERQQIGSISKQGSKFLRYLMVEAGHTASRHDPDLKRFYFPAFTFFLGFALYIAYN
jgi:transposase